jgi:hypothetical protein
VEQKEVIKPLDLHKQPIHGLKVSDPDHEHDCKSDHRFHDTHLSSKENGKVLTISIMIYGCKPVEERDRNDTDDDIQNRACIPTDFIHFNLLAQRVSSTTGAILVN